MAQPTDRWFIPASELIDWHEWGDEFVVRVASRAETHLLSQAAGSVLLVLLERGSPLTLEDVYAKACDIADTQSQDDAQMTADERNFLQGIVAGFERLGIASRHTAC
jgi:hypothetical protein